MTGLWNDMRFALRGLLRAPGFTVITIGTLALGIGAVTAVFTLVDGVLLSPLPFDEPQELVELQHVSPSGRDGMGISDGLYLLYREQVNSLNEIALYRGGAVNLVQGGEPARISIQRVTPSFFRVLRVEAALGRTFVEDEGAAGGAAVAMLSDELWKSRFGGDPSTVGRTVDVDGVRRTVVGVMPQGFGHPDGNARMWLPITVDPTQARPLAFNWSGVARLAPGSTAATLQNDLESLLARFPELFPDSGTPAGVLREFELRSNVLPLREAVVGDVGSTLWILLGTVGFVLLIACANVANLLLVRSEGRHREYTIRAALGAGRVRLLRSFLSEAVVLATVGGLAGLALAVVMLRGALALVPSGLPRVAEIGLDVRVAGFTAVIAIGCALLFGLLPIFRSGDNDLAAGLRDGGARGATGGRRSQRRRSALVIVQIALALVLLVGSGLTFRTFQALRSIDPGFSHDRVLTARLSVPSTEIADLGETADFFRQLRERLSAQPGVEAVGFALSAPLTGGRVPYFDLQVEDHPRGPDDLPILVTQNFVDVGYFEAMGIEVSQGRAFRDDDGGGGTRPLIVSESFATQWWPTVSPVGRRVRFGFPGEDWHTIVGVVADARYERLPEVPVGMVYWPTTVDLRGNTSPIRLMDIVIKTAGDPLIHLPALRREVSGLNPRIPISNPRTMDDVFRAASSRTSFTMALLGAASGTALFLGLVGIYGVISYIVSQRTREIGVRMALGATIQSVQGMVVRQGLFLALAGIAVGLITAGVLSSAMTSILYGVSALDPLTYGAVAVVLLIASLGASWLPARRAARVDPIQALRGD